MEKGKLKAPKTRFAWITVYTRSLRCLLRTLTPAEILNEAVPFSCWSSPKKGEKPTCDPASLPVVFYGNRGGGVI